MRRRTGASICCWIGSPWPRLVGVGAASAVVGQVAPLFAQVAGEQTVGIPTTNLPVVDGTRKPGAATPTAAPAAPAVPGSSGTENIAPAGAAADSMAGAPAPAAIASKISEPLLTEDDLSVSGYMPGYRRYTGLGLSPAAPRSDALPGGVTPAYGSPRSAEEWSFRWSGFMQITLQPSLYERRKVAQGQRAWTLHTPPLTIEEWYSFTSTNTQPSNWVNLNFQYGNTRVAAITSIDTWNPSEPTTYYQLGSQYFINNAYLSYSPQAIGGVRLHCNAGMFSVTYGGLGRYGSGIYVNPVAGLLRGVGETLGFEYDLRHQAMITAEHGVMIPRNGRAPSNVISSPVNSYLRPTWPAAWVHHAHAGMALKTEPQVQFQLHYINNWSQDERVQTEQDNPATRQMDETNIPDGRISVYAADARMISDVYGYLAAGVAYLDAKNAFPVKGVMTYGGDGETLSDRWLGLPSNGTGQMLVTAVNYGVSLGKIAARPRPFAGDGPDVFINTGFHWATTRQNYANWNRRNRYKGGLDALYTFLRNVGVGARVDAVVPNSKDRHETYCVLAMRLQLKTDWTSREQINLIYARWFYGSHTRNEGTGERARERLDSQLLALNFNLWW